MKSIKNFENHYNTLIRKWYRSKYKGVAFIKINGQKPITKTMPEPYYGNIRNNLYSILLLHPANNSEDKQYLSRKQMKSILNGIDYATYATPFVQLDISKKFHYPNEEDWWKKKNYKITQLSQLIADDNIRPFAIEIYPWHYTSWGLNETNYIKKHKAIHKEINQYVITPFIHGIDHSKLQIGLAISQEAVKILKEFEFTEDTVWQQNNHQGITSWPKNKNGQEVNKTFTYLKIRVPDNISKDDDRWTNIQGQETTTNDLSIKCIKVLGIKATRHGELPGKNFWLPGGVIDQILNYIKTH